MSSWWEYVVRTAKTDVQKKMAEGTGISETAFSRWKQGKNSPEAPHVIAFARGYNRPPVEALVAARILTEADAAEVIEVHRELDAITDEELLDEVRNRMKRATHAVETQKKSDAQTTGYQSKEGKVVRPAHWGGGDNPPPPPSVEQAQAASLGEKESDHQTPDDDDMDEDPDQDTPNNSPGENQ